MAIERTELVDFLATVPPFDRLSDHERSRLLQHFFCLYLNHDNQQTVMPASQPALYLMRTAVVDVLDADGQTRNRLESGDSVGLDFALGNAAALPELKVITDGLMYRLPAEALRKAMDSNAGFAAALSPDRPTALRHTTPELEDAGIDWTQQPVGSVLTRPLVSIAAEESIVSAAKRMSAEGVSCLPIVDNTGLVGLITDRDLRNRVLAQARDTETPVRDIMTTALVTLTSNQSLFDALLLMSQHNIHHLPIVDDDKQPLGVLTTSDLLAQQRNAPLVFVKSLHKARSRDDLVALAAALPAHISSYAQNARDAATTGRLLSAVTDTITRRLIDLWVAEHGEPPCAYAWMAFGSQGREDQTLHSDQDNGLLLANDSTASDREWFAEFAEFVCHGLADCGIPLCPGNVMAMNPQWRVTAEEWEAHFRHWVDEPTPDSVLHSMIFFDSRCIAGDAQLYREHRAAVAKYGQQSRFLAMLAGHVADLPVPLGLFDRLRTQTSQGKAVIDIKVDAIAVLNDIVRLHALSHGVTLANTEQRLQALSSSPTMASDDVRSLRDAWRFLAALRLRWQVSAMVDTSAPNALRPDALSGLERQQLKEALRVIKSAQRGGAQTYRMGY